MVSKWQTQASKRGNLRRVHTRRDCVKWPLCGPTAKTKEFTPCNGWAWQGPEVQCNVMCSRWRWAPHIMWRCFPNSKLTVWLDKLSSRETRLPLLPKCPLFLVLYIQSRVSQPHTAEVWGWVVICRGWGAWGCLVYCRVFNSIPGL